VTSPPCVSAIILNTTKHAQTLAAVNSLLEQEGNFSLEIIVADNSLSVSKDYARERKALQSALCEKKNVHLLFLEKNGYSYGNNRGAEKANGEVLFIMNPDISLPQKNALQMMIDFLEKNPDVAILAPKQKNPDGSTEKNVRRFPTLLGQCARRISLLRNIFPFSSLVRAYEYVDIDENVTQPIDWAQSSFWAVHGDFWKEMGGFDERYFIFMADVDLCQKAWKSGKKVVYFPQVQVLADGIRCSSGGVFHIFTKKILRIHLKDALTYHRKRVREERQDKSEK